MREIGPWFLSVQQLCLEPSHLCSQRHHREGEYAGLAAVHLSGEGSFLPWTSVGTRTGHEEVVLTGWGLGEGVIWVSPLESRWHTQCVSPGLLPAVPSPESGTQEVTNPCLLEESPG